MTSPESDSRLHVFKKYHFPKPTWCTFCGEFIWGLGKQGFFCPFCEYGVHKKCLTPSEHTPCVKRDKKPLREMTPVELEAYVSVIEKREQRLHQLQEELHRKIQKFEEDKQKHSSFNLSKQLSFRATASLSATSLTSLPNFTPKDKTLQSGRATSFREVKEIIGNTTQSSEVLSQILSDPDTRRFVV
jgi:hypothetical protein